MCYSPLVTMPWIRRKLRGTEVLVETDASGRPQTDDAGRVEIRYKASENAKPYRAAVRNLEPTGDPADEEPRELSGFAGAATGRTQSSPRRAPARADDRTRKPARPAAAHSDAAGGDPIIIYTDGACTGNPGPMGIGAVIVDGDRRHEICEYLGQGTNNIAELTAIERSLQAIPAADRDRRVLLHSDSNYAIGLLGKGWKAKANAELVARIRRVVAQFPNLRFIKVQGHAGVPENERCDELGRAAIARGY